MRLFSYAERPVHLGPRPAERLERADGAAGPVPPAAPLAWTHGDPASIVPAMGEYAAMLDAIRDGPAKRERATIPEDPEERSRHLKAFAHFCDADAAGICRVPGATRLAAPWENPDVAGLAEMLRTRQTRTLASGIDVIMAELKEAASRPPAPLGEGQGFALVLLHAHPRAPETGEAGCGWIEGAEAHRSALRAAETAAVLAAYLRLLGWESRAHSASAADVDLNALAVEAGLCSVEGGAVVSPFHGTRFALAAVTTALPLAPDRPLAPGARGGGWRDALGVGGTRPAWARDPYARRRFVDGPHPFETLKRVETPTTYIDEENIPRVPKRTDMFARAQFGDMGRANQENAKAGAYVRKSASGFAFRPALGAFVLIGDGPWAEAPAPGTDDPEENARRLKATAYWLGADAVGLSRCPDWAWYSHDAAGEPLEPRHADAVSIIVDQGHETMEGASGDDWISVAQSMRAYLRFALIGGVLAAQIRRLGFSAKAHTVMDGEVLQPPLLLLSGLGEVSRIGEVILNPFLGPRLKSGVVTTDMPMTHDRPIDFGLQRFCESCNKCARECPSGAITAGPKRMFNGYEIWKSDSQKCTTYRIGTLGGAMCGRCMKTCPWNLEGLFAEAPFRRAAMRWPGAAPALARLDDALGRGGINPVKTWWWDLEMVDEGPYGPPRHPTNRRGLQRDLTLRPEDQTLAVYPAPLAPHPWPWPFPMDREAGVAAYRALVGADAWKAAKAEGRLDGLRHVYANDRGEPPVQAVRVSRLRPVGPDVLEVAFAPEGGPPLAAFEPGAHVDVLVAPEFLRPYSLMGDPDDPSEYVIAVKREDAGRGGSKLLHRIFAEGRRVMVGRPLNHFPLDEAAPFTLLMGGGVGVTPLIAMAHRLHARGAAFRLHFSTRTRGAGFVEALAAAPWAERVRLHVSDEGGRADLDAILADPPEGARLMLCGPAGYMAAVRAAAAAAGWPEDAVREEVFAVPQEDERPEWAFTLRLARSGREVAVAEGRAATEALAAAGVAVDVKCSDGLCGVCRCGVLTGAVDHRDHVLTKAERAGAMILCRSRSAEPGGTVEVDL